VIQVFKPSMTEEEIDAVAGVLRSGWIGLGPKTAEFEAKFAEFIGTKHAVAVNSCTAALDLALKLLDVNHGHEVIVPTMTFVSTAHCVAYRLAMPVFADVDPHTLAIDLEDVRRKITSRTRAIIPVHYSGRPVDLDALKEIAGGIPIIEDCAHATGARYKGRSVGSIGDIGCFSFHAVKNLAMGDGGALTLNAEPWMLRSKRLRWLGIDRGTWDRTATDKSYWWQYVVDEVGLKCHMNDISAAIGLVQLRRLESLNARRREIARRYSEAFAAYEFMETPPGDTAGCESAWHIYCLKVPQRDDLCMYLQDKGIATGVHYSPIHLYSCYGNKPHLPVAEEVFTRIVSLPMYPDMTDAEIQTVIDAITAYYVAAGFIGKRHATVKPPAKGAGAPGLPLAGRGTRKRTAA
jgi:perosamine synthetase